MAVFLRIDRYKIPGTGFCRYLFSSSTFKDVHFKQNKKSIFRVGIRVDVSKQDFFNS